MVSTAPRVASTEAPISSLKYGKCHWSGASTTPSSEMNRPAVVFFMTPPMYAHYVRSIGPGEALGLGERQLGRARCDLPDRSLGICEGAAVAAPLRPLGGLRDLGACVLGLGEHLVDPLLGADVVREGDSPEAAPLRRHARAGGELVPRVERQRGLAVAEREADPLALLLEDRPAEPLRVEAPRAREIADADSDQGDVRPHQYSSFWGRSSVISSQGAFEPTKMCSLGRILGASASDPSATWTYLPSRTTE